MTIALGVAGLLVLAMAGVISGAAVLAFGRPPQPLAFGTIQWDGDVGVTVDGVTRTERLGAGSGAVAARGEFYVVHARILAPFGFRPIWDDRYVRVETFAGRGATMPDRSFSVDSRAQAFLDRTTGRPGAEHLVRGAQQHEDLVFDLPKNVEQPAIVFLPANDPMRLIELAFGQLWQPHRFNIRYD